MYLISRYFLLVSSTASGKKTKPLYKRKPPLICVRAFQNGNRDNYARITVPDLQQVHVHVCRCSHSCAKFTSGILPCVGTCSICQLCNGFMKRCLPGEAVTSI